MAEDVGLEPTDGCPPTVFKTVAIAALPTLQLSLVYAPGLEPGNKRLSVVPRAVCVDIHFNNKQSYPGFCSSFKVC